MEALHNFSVVAARADDTRVDLRHILGDLKYDNALPGGYGSATFSLSVPHREIARYVNEIDDIEIYDGPSLVWEGAVEEIDRAERATQQTVVYCLGYQAALRGPRLRRVYVDTDLSQWRAGKDRGTGYSQTASAQFAAPTTDATDGDCLQLTLPNGQAVTTADDIEAIWEAPPGCYITRVTASYRTSGASASWVVMADDTLPTSAAGWTETVKSSASIASSTGTIDYTTSGQTRRVLMVALDVTAGHTPASDEYVRLYNVKIYCAPHPDGGAMSASSVEPVTVVRDILQNYVPELDSQPSVTPGGAMSTFTQLAFREPVTPQQVVEHMVAASGLEWGVWANRKMYLRLLADMHSTDKHLVSGEDGPAWWIPLTAERGCIIDLSLGLDKLVNKVIVSYTGTDGFPKSLEVDRFGDPSNPLNDQDGGQPRRVRAEAITLPGTQTDAAASVFANAYLDDWSAPIVKGTVTVPATLSVGKLAVARTNFSGNNAPMTAAGLLAGTWIETPGFRPATSLVVAPNSFPGVFPVRQVQVDAVAGTATLTVDTTPSTFTALLASLQQR